MGIEESILIFRIAIAGCLLGVSVFSGKRISQLFGMTSFLFIVLAILAFVGGQALELSVIILGGPEKIWQQVFHTISILMFALGLALLFFKNLEGANQKKRLAKHQEWLTHVYENIPAGVFVSENGEIIYNNSHFLSLQVLFEETNPFVECTKDQQEIWLTTPSFKRYAYWVTRFNLDDNGGTVFIINDITTVKMHESFIKKIGVDLTEHGQAGIASVLSVFSQFLPSSLVLVSRYQVEDQLFHYVDHAGDCSGINIYESIAAKFPNIKRNSWNWLNSNNIEDSTMDVLFSEYKPDRIGYVILSDERKNTLGSVIILLKGPQSINEQLLDFLSLASVRIRSELAYLHNQKQMRKSQKQYREFIARSNEAVVDMSVQPGVLMALSTEEQLKALIKGSTVKEVNEKFKAMFEISGKLDADYVFSIKSLKHVLNYVLSSGYSNEKIEVIHETRQGETHWIACRCMTEIEDGCLTRLWLVIQDITESKRHIQKLEYQTLHDGLTGLPNRNSLIEMLDSNIDQSLQFGFKVGLLLIDLDRFKEINDALGHHYGDVLLKKIEPRVNPILKKYRAKLSRIGGDEFAVIMPSIQSAKEARQLASEILLIIKQPFDLGQLNVEISGSVGISIFPDDGVDSSTLLRCVDVAMYKAKSSAGGVVNYRDDIDDNSPRRLTIMASMGSGLKGGDFYLCYQPKVNIKNNAIQSCEALIRWNHPQLGALSPAEFIPLAEMNDSIILITEWVIDNALLKIKHWNEMGLAIKVSINVSTRNLLDENLIPFLSEKLIEYQVPAHLLEVEITESALMADPDKALETLNKISRLGVSISVDDFGTGYSSMVYLRQLPLDALKVDITFVRNMCNNEQDRIIVQSIVQLAHNLSLTVVAEGAENIETVKALEEIDCDEIQGFYFSKPMVADDFTQFCLDWKR